MKPHDEIEIKLRITSARKLKQRLKALQFRKVKARVHERNVLYDFPDGSLAKAGCALRLRSAGGQHWLTFKGDASRSDKYKIRKEIETGVADPEQLAGILKALRLHPIFFYEKRRTTYAAMPEPRRGKPPTVAFDETAVGDYVELEGPRRWIDQVALRLGFCEDDYVTTSYVGLLLAAGKEVRRSRGTSIRELVDC